MSGNQSGAEKDNKLLFKKQWILLFSKSKMAATNFSQSCSVLGPSSSHPGEKRLTVVIGKQEL